MKNENSKQLTNLIVNGKKDEIYKILTNIDEDTLARALCIAIYMGRREVVSLTLSLGANYLKRYSMNKGTCRSIPLIDLIRRGYLDLGVPVFLENMNKIDFMSVADPLVLYEMLHVCPNRLKGELIDSYLNRKNISPNYTNQIIMYACKDDDIEIIQKYHRQGASLLYQDDYGNTPLHICCLYKSPDAFSCLIQTYEKTNILNKQRKTPLHMVFEKTHNYTNLLPDSSLRTIIEQESVDYDFLDDDIQEYISNQPPKADSQFEQKKYPGYKDVVCYMIEAILKKPAIQDIPDINGNTPLMSACSRGQLKYVRLLLDFGANPNHQNKYEQTALFKAKMSNIVETLIEFGADINVIDKYGYSPFECLVMNQLPSSSIYLKYKPQLKQENLIRVLDRLERQTCYLDPLVVKYLLSQAKQYCCTTERYPKLSLYSHSDS